MAIHPNSSWLKPLILVVFLFFSPFINAHVLLPQKGYLNLAPDGAYLVISIPISSFTEINHNDASVWSEVDLNKHLNEVQKKLNSCLQFKSSGQVISPNLAMVYMSKVDDANDSSSNQLTAMMKFALTEDPMLSIRSSSADFHLSVTCFGQARSEKQFEIFVLTQKELKRTLLLTPENPEAYIFPSNAQNLWSFFRFGLKHIFQGIDHILFLIALLISRQGLKHWVIVLSSFTLAHALTFALTSLGYVSFDKEWIEVAIALTIVLLSSLQALKRGLPLVYETTLVFAFGLVHGLGFANALNQSQLNSDALLLPILGFNLGIEFGQLIIALFLVRLLNLANQYPRMKSKVIEWIHYFIIFLGVFWIYQRLLPFEQFSQ